MEFCCNFLLFLPPLKSMISRGAMIGNQVRKKQKESTPTVIGK